MLPIELVQARLLSLAKGDESALRLWARFFPESDPLAFDTEANGDTQARGRRNGYTIQLTRTRKSLIVSFSAADRAFGPRPIKTFQEADVPWNDVRELGAKIGEELDAGNFELTVYCSLVQPTLQDALQSLRLRVPELPIPAHAREAELRLVAERPIKSQPALSMAIQCRWRNGARTVSEDDEVDGQPTEGLMIEIQPVTESVEPVEIDSIQEILGEMIDRVQLIRRDGTNGL